MEAPAFFLGKAAQCRRLAQEILAKNDPAIGALLAMAAEFDGKVIAADTQATGQDDSALE
jgi:hypothetical protein